MVHDSADISNEAKIGNNTNIWQNCIVQGDVVIGDGCNIGANVFVENTVRIGDNVKIKNNVVLYAGVVVENDVFLGPSCVFTNVINPRAFISRKNEFKKTLIKKGATVGANATIVCGNTIGEYAMVGAGAVVIRDVLDYEVIVGNPGHVVGYVCQCGCRLTDDFICSNCGKEYYKNKNGIVKEREK